MSFFKILGLIFLLCASSLFGFYKGNSLVKRSKDLSEICISLEKMSQLIKNGTGDLKKIMEESFGNLIEIGNSIRLKSDFLLKEDTELFSKLISEIGISDREREYKRIVLYKSLFKEQQIKAEQKAKSLCKLYNSCGFWVGLAFCIIFV